MLAPDVPFEQFMQSLRNDQQIRRDQFRQIYNRPMLVIGHAEEADNVLVAGSNSVMPNTPSISDQDPFERPPVASVNQPQMTRRPQNPWTAPADFGQRATLPVVPNLANFPQPVMGSTNSDSGFVSQSSGSICLHDLDGPLRSQQLSAYIPANVPQNALYHPQTQQGTPILPPLRV